MSASIPDGSTATVEDTDEPFPGNFLVCDFSIQKLIDIFFTLVNLEWFPQYV
jgi:hypothetical protein